MKPSNDYLLNSLSQYLFILFIDTAYFNTVVVISHKMLCANIWTMKGVEFLVWFKCINPIYVEWGFFMPYIRTLVSYKAIWTSCGKTHNFHILLYRSPISFAHIITCNIRNPTIAHNFVNICNNSVEYNRWVVFTVR